VVLLFVMHVKYQGLVPMLFRYFYKTGRRGGNLMTSRSCLMGICTGGQFWGFISPKLKVENQKNYIMIMNTVFLCAVSILRNLCLELLNMPLRPLRPLPTEGVTSH